ncbi:sugar ABC transporter substrate-binding protein [Halomicrobium urmianum]|uniref:sugar ABC transporter substrate-binding protein n=1 Tax=Halomicrobium urmianum TaxID=1586233 RepID=UPI001CD94353|nr:sugar ABC transporter substrate-binding protein [Halomicrobium urmianum]
MVTHDASTSFFDPTIAGLHDAASQLGWSANFTGPSSGFSVEEQVSILESTVDSGPDVIATTIPDPSAFDNVINRALENDIPVVTYNTLALSRDQMREKYGRALAYTGQDQVAAGYVCGLAMLDRLPDDASLVTPGLSDPGHSALSARADGMEMAIQQNSDIELTDRLNYTGDSNEGISRIENHLTSNPELDGIMGADAFTWFIGNALENQDMTDEVVGGGFDLTTDTLEHINNEVLNYTIGQDPYSQGYMPTMQLFAYMDRGIPPKDYATGAEVIDQSNIEFAMERSGGWGELRNFHNA